PRKATIVRLKNKNLIDTTNIVTILNSVQTGGRVDFLNGKDELTATNLWSMDDEDGVIYLASPTPDNTDLSISYTYQPIYNLSSSEWDWSKTQILRDSVSIKETAWKTRSVSRQELPATNGITVLDLSKLSVEKGSLDLEVTVSGSIIDLDNIQHPFQKEVDYVDGASELGGKIIQTTETILKNLTSTDPGSGDQVITFDLKENISEDE